MTLPLARGYAMARHRLALVIIVSSSSSSKSSSSSIS